MYQETAKPLNPKTLKPKLYAVLFSEPGIQLPPNEDIIVILDISWVQQERITW